MDHVPRPLASSPTSTPSTLPAAGEEAAADPGRRDFLGAAFTIAGGAVVFLAGLDAAESSEAHAPSPGRRRLQLGGAPLRLPHRHRASASAAAPACAPARPRTRCPTASSAPGSSATTSRAPARPTSTPPTAAWTASPRRCRPRHDRPRPSSSPSCATTAPRLALRAGLPGRRVLPDQGRRGAGRREALHRLRLLRPGLPLRHRASSTRRPTPPTSARCATTASPRGCKPACVRGLPDRRAPFGDMRRLEDDPVRQHHRPRARLRCCRADAAHRAAVLLPRPRQGGALMPEILGYVFPNDIHILWSPDDRDLPVHHRAGGRRLHRLVALTTSSAARSSGRWRGWPW